MRSHRNPNSRRHDMDHQALTDEIIDLTGCRDAYTTTDINGHWHVILVPTDPSLEQTALSNGITEHQALGNAVQQAHSDA